MVQMEHTNIVHVVDRNQLVFEAMIQFIKGDQLQTGSQEVSIQAVRAELDHWGVNYND